MTQIDVRLFYQYVWLWNYNTNYYIIRIIVQWFDPIVLQKIILRKIVKLWHRLCWLCNVFMFPKLHRYTLILFLSKQGQASALKVVYIFQVFGPQSCFRSSHQRCTLKKRVLRNFIKFTWKFLCQSLFFRNVVGLSLQLYYKRDSTQVFLNFIKKETLAQVFFCEFCEISKNTFFT